jgi:hypothetical protein
MSKQISNNQRVIAKRSEHQRGPTIISVYPSVQKGSAYACSITNGMNLE